MIIKPEHGASFNNIQYYVKFVFSLNKFSLGVSNNTKCMHNPIFFIYFVMFKFKVGSIFSLFVIVCLIVFFIQILCHVLCIPMKVW